MESKRKKSEIWSEAYKVLTVGDVERIDRLNTENHWEIPYETAMRLFSMHKRARMTGNIHKMECVEYRLIDCNFHREAALLHDGKYQEALCEFCRL